MTPMPIMTRLESFSLSVKKLMTPGMMMNRVHHPSKKMSILKRPMALPPKMMPSAMMAIPQMIGLICFILLYSFFLWQL